MNLNVNGQTIRLDAPATVRDLVEHLELAGQACAVEVNKRLVPSRNHAEHELGDGDVVEVVTLVGGG